MKRKEGYTLIELVAVIIIIGILAGIASTQFLSKSERAKYTATVAEMEALARAIAGNVESYQQGTMTDFGYVGDVGSLPPNLNALATNPGYATWDGPYIKGNFQSDDFIKDPWGAAYLLNDVLLRSVGSGENIDKLIATNSAALLSNSISGFICDADQNRPGSIYKDSFAIDINYPDGLGGTEQSSTLPDASGYFNIAGLPIGHYELNIIYLPDVDTVAYGVTIMPGRDVNLDIVFPADLW